MMMWMDRELEEHQVYDHFSTLSNAQQTNNASILQQYPNGANGQPPPNGGIYAHLQSRQQHSSTPTTTNSMGMESSLGGGSPPPMSMDLDQDGPLHQHATLPAADHRLPMDSHHLDDNDQDIYGAQHLYHQPHHLMASANADHHHMMLSSSSSCLGGCGDQETAMMMHNGDSDLLGGSIGHAHMVGSGGGGGGGDEIKSSKPKDRPNYLLIYARQFGLNDRGCYVSAGLASLAFLLLVIVIAMGATWPGKRLFCPCFLLLATFRLQ